ncbi:Spc97/Spc98 family protein [Xylariomycetidae sp. FL2044]|nr:Spc97/Spc98 family protein [Xylariomycetidae sp. FL2044]
MLHEILLSLSGHPSPLLRNDQYDPAAAALVSPPERELLRSAGHLSDLHCKLIAHTASVSASHPSVICRAVSTTTSSVHLAAFQRKVLEVEESILNGHASLVGAYNIVPLTAILGQFSDWTRRMEWLWQLLQFMSKEENGHPCSAAQLIDRLRDELQTGYADVEETARSLLRSAEIAWVKQVSAWVLYGRIPVLGGNDFFIRKHGDAEQVYSINHSLLPSFVTPSTASSMLFIGTCLVRVRNKSSLDQGMAGTGHLSSQIHDLAQLDYPLSSAMFSRAITSIRLTLSRTTLQKLLPLSKVAEMLKILREFFLIGRGEFAMALTQQADEKVRNRWRRADNRAYEKRDSLGTIVVKEGELAAVLSKTFAALGSMQGQHADEDEELELARDLLQLNLSPPNTATPGKYQGKTGKQRPSSIAPTPFCNLLFSVPVVLTLQIPSPLDLFLTSADLQVYTSINSYLLSIRRAHLRLTDLWKITSLRRHHPAPPRPPFSTTKAGISKTKVLHERWSTRSSAMRSTWSTSSAAIFFLAETEAYLQVEVVEGLWDDFFTWLTSTGRHHPLATATTPSTPFHNKPSSNDKRSTNPTIDYGSSDEEEETRETPSSPYRDPQTLAHAHHAYLAALTTRLLLTRPDFTQPLYDLLVHMDHLVALVHRLQGVWNALDLEADEGVVDAFSNLEVEEREVTGAIRQIERKVKIGIEGVIAVLRGLSLDGGLELELDGAQGEIVGYDDDDSGFADQGGGVGEAGEEWRRRYRPRRVGGIDRLLMKLDFGGWFDSTTTAGAAAVNPRGLISSTP